MTDAHESPGSTAHCWAIDGEPLHNSTSGASFTMLTCPRCDDVILDVVHIQSGPLSVPRNQFSPLGNAWFARCPACGWTSRDAASEWDLLEAVEKVRSEP